MENHHAFHGKTHYFYGHFFNSYFDITRGYPIHVGWRHPRSPRRVDAFVREHQLEMDIT